MKLAIRAREERELKRRIGWLGAAVALGILLLAGRLWYLEIFKGDDYFAKSSGNFVKELRVASDRGMILDRKGQILADNRPSYDVFLTPAFCQDCPEVIGRLAGQLGLDDEDLGRVVSAVENTRGLERFRPVLVQYDLTRDDLDVLEANKDSLPGVDVVGAPHRNYRKGSLGAHALGYMGEANPDDIQKARDDGRGLRIGDYVGKIGVERRYERWLRGVDGVERVVADAKGRKLPELEELIPPGERFVPSRPGANVVLSLDARLQAAAEEAFDKPAGSAVVMDVNTGYVLAMVSKPGFDPNRMTGRISRAELRELMEDPLKPMLLRATQNHYHPGSVQKVVSGLAALEHGFGHPIQCGGGYTLGKRRWRCHKESGHGILNLEEALKVSCDTWFYAAADKLGIDPFAEMSRRFGLGEVTGLDLGFEVPGIVPSTEYHDKRTKGGYTKGFALNSVIGQGDSNVTPLQMAVVYAAIANGGTIYRPQLVRQIVRPDGSVVEDFLPDAKRKLGVKRENLEIVRRGLDKVVNEPGGTGFRHRPANVRVAGKSGTAQVVRIGNIRLRKEQMDWFSRDHAWFAAYAPAENPEIAVVVLVEHGGHGGAEAAPIVMKIIEKYLELKEEDRASARSGVDRELPRQAPPAALEPPSGTPELPVIENGEGVAG
ncbi:penicillin-binding protein 2 [Vulgatibacter incomptus]|uniref:Cell division protein FtsI n=1 Tax=Vulgatibacter incomptus TaxID=1391653 RepID=A0A0K1PDM8_9BACT|nr:penicillin-binding protein 2 [Vulgatibacter incomptus]AKU91204.1 Cell division protein FtsI [Vulgatibacter incomptus]